MNVFSIEYPEYHIAKELQKIFKKKIITPLVFQ